MSTLSSLVECLASRNINVETLQKITLELAHLSEKQAPDQRQQWCEARLVAILGQFDNKKAVLGVLSDLPLSKAVERWSIRKLVEWAFLKIAEDVGDC